MLDKTSPIPLYAQLETILRKKILNQEWTPNSKIPSENSLCETYGLSRMTVRSVISTLVKEGLIYSVQGKGTFVAPSKILAKSPSYLGIREQLELQGYKIQTKIVACEYRYPEQSIRNTLKLDSNKRILFIQRVRYADGIPVSIHSSFIPEDYCENMTRERLEQDQLCNILEEDYHLKTAKVYETLESILATDHEAKLLDIKKGYPLLLLTDVNKTEQGIIYEYTKISFRGDKVKLDFEYTV